MRFNVVEIWACSYKVFIVTQADRGTIRTNNTKSSLCYYEVGSTHHETTTR